MYKKIIPMKIKQLLLTISCILLFTILKTSAQPATFSSRGVGGGGALFALSINPANNNEYFIACDMGELFHTIDFGATYSQVNFKQLIGGHNSKVCYTTTPGLLYCINYANDKVIPVKSTDNGVTWAKLAGNPDESEEIYTIDVDYNNANRVIISQYGAIYFSTDGGTTFKSIHTAATSSGNVVAGVFFDNANIYIATNDGVLISTNSGTSFTIATITGIPAAEGIWSFAGAKVGSVTRFFCLTGNTGDIYPGLVGSDYSGFMKGVYSVDYGIGNWSSKMTGITVGTDYPMFVGMAANDINTVYLAGSNSSSEPIILKTTNAGSNWANTFMTANNKNINTGWSGAGGDRGWSYGECPFAISVASNNAQRVIFGDLGFVHKTSNGGTTWQQGYIKSTGEHAINTAITPGQNYESCGIENTTCWQVHWSNATTMWACFSDIRGIRSTDSGKSWAFNYTGNSANSTYRVVQHPTNGTLYAACSNIHDMYQSTRLADAQLDAADANGKILYSANNGATWINLHTFNHPVFWIALDPSNPNRAYASVIHYSGGSGVGGVYICNDLDKLAASTWTLLSNPPRTEKHPASIVVLNDGKMVCTYSGRRTTAFTKSSGVFIYDPTGNSWTDVSDAGMQYWTKDIVIDPNDAQQNTWYVGVFSGWGGPPNGLGGLYKTTNRGTSWKRLTDPMIDRVTSCTFNPSDPNQVYITTETQGLWVCSNINAATPVFAEVTAYPFKQPERVFFNPYNKQEMWVSSFGNGMKMGALLPTGIPAFTATTADDVYPNPSKGVIHLVNQSATEVTIYDVLGKQAGKIPLGKGENELNISFLTPGIYFLNWENKKTKIIIER
jgi:photosystem II stability/assembly factor-like uncharacterized protein